MRGIALLTASKAILSNQLIGALLVVVVSLLVFPVSTFAASGSQLQNVRLGFRVYENNEQVEILKVEPGEIIELKVYVSEAQQMAAISGTVLLPEEHITVVGVQQLFGVCSAWDSQPEAVGSAIEFACAQGSVTASSGVLFTIRAVVNSSFRAGELSFRDALYLDSSREFRSLETSLLELQSINVVQTSAEAGAQSGSTSVMVVLVNFVLIVGVILSLVMGYKYYKANRQYAR